MAGVDTDLELRILREMVHPEYAGFLLAGLHNAWHLLRRGEKPITPTPTRESRYVLARPCGLMDEFVSMAHAYDVTARLEDVVSGLSRQNNPQNFSWLLSIVYDLLQPETVQRERAKKEMSHFAVSVNSDPYELQTKIESLIKRGMFRVFSVRKASSFMTDHHLHESQTLRVRWVRICPPLKQQDFLAYITPEEYVPFR